MRSRSPVRAALLLALAIANAALAYGNGHVRAFLADALSGKARSPRARRATVDVAAAFGGRRSSGRNRSVCRARRWPPVLTLPNSLSLARVAAVPCLMAAHLGAFHGSSTLAFFVFLVARLTDWLDGFLARRMGLCTPLGALLDSVADKLLVATALVLLCSKPPVALAETISHDWWIAVPACVIVGREVAVSALREWRGGDARQSPAVLALGKWKTALQMMGILFLFGAQPLDAWAGGCARAVARSGVAVVWLSAALSFVSLLARCASLMSF